MPFIAQHVLQGPSGLPEDRFVNVFHFMETEPGDPTTEDASPIITAALQDFFQFSGSTGSAVEDYLQNSLDPLVEIRVYREGDPEPREPVITTYTQNRGAAAPLPNEVALVSSFYANRNLPRTRGRVYIGPLNLSGATVDPDGQSLPSGAMRAVWAEAATRLATTADPTSPWALRWAVRSAGPYADGSGTGIVTYSRVTDGWVDNAWDTQRRRGLDATARTIWTVGS